jgi:hypothetical protein
MDVTEHDAKYDYLELVVAFRSTSNMNVYLSDESEIVPVNAVYDPDDPNRNIFGTFSKDYIAGAMRVAIVEEVSADSELTEDERLRLLWAPNSTYQLTDNNNGTYDFKANGTAEDNYTFITYDDGKYVPTPVPDDYYASKKFVVDKTGAVKLNSEEYYSGNSPVLVSLTPQAGSYDYKTVRIRIWFEGTDREAHQALAGGNVSIRLKFIGIKKDTNEEGKAALEKVAFDQDSATLSGLTEDMVFSTDGRVWTKYNAAAPNLPTMEKGSSIYIKIPETSEFFETDYIKFTKD